MNHHFIGGAAFHFLSRKLLLFKLLWENTCRGVSLVSQELLLVVYLCRYLDLLYLYVSFTDTLIKVLHIMIALGVVMLMRYSPKVVETYDADFDTFPRAALIAPAFVLALVFNKIGLVMEIFKQFSVYLESVVLIPQFYLLYKREKYDSWVLVLTILLGLERIVHNSHYLDGPALALKKDPYGFYTAVVQALVFLVGLLVLVLQKIHLKHQAGLNEATEKPAFDEEWEAGKFKFEDGEKAKPPSTSQSSAVI